MLKYTAYGELRTGSSTTDYRYTGQREEAEIGLYYYVARFFDPAVGRFISADTIVPDPGSSQGYDRYGYVNGNPINRSDPSGHCYDEDGDGQCDGGGYGVVQPPVILQEQEFSMSKLMDDEVRQNSEIISPFITNTFLYEFQNKQTKITASCTESRPCIGPSTLNYDSNPQHPDYYYININGGEGLSIGLTLIKDRFNNFYAGPGVGFGKSLTGVSVIANGGFLGNPDDGEIPFETDLTEFLSGMSFNGGIGLIGDISVSYSPFADTSIKTSSEYGLTFLAQIGVSINYMIRLGK